MFLIAKIVRGRRLLHELEQQEKEKERERQQQHSLQQQQQQQGLQHGQQQRHDGSGTAAIAGGNIDKTGGGPAAGVPGAQSNGAAAAARRRRFSSLQSKTLGGGTPLQKEPWHDEKPSTSAFASQNTAETVNRLDASPNALLRRRKTWSESESRRLGDSARLTPLRRLRVSFSVSTADQKPIPVPTCALGPPTRSTPQRLTEREEQRQLSKLLLRQRHSQQPQQHQHQRRQSRRDRLYCTARMSTPSDGAARKKLQHNRSTLLPIDNDIRRAVRQKTDSCLPSDSSDGGGLADETLGSCTAETVDGGRIRRTSSMPSVVLDETERTVVSAALMRHYNYDLKLSKLQKRALRFTWHRLHTRNGGRRVENVFEEVFDRLTKIVPIMREMFTTRIFLSAMSKGENGSSTTLREHARLIVRVVDAAIKNLDVDERRRTDTGTDVDPLRVGHAHGSLRPYGFVASLWEKLGETIIDVVLAQEAVRDLPGAGQAWVVLTACLVDQLRAGFETARDPSQPPLRLSSGTCPFAVPHQYRFQQQKQIQQQQEENQRQKEQQQQQRAPQPKEWEKNGQSAMTDADEAMRRVSLSCPGTADANTQEMEQIYDYNCGETQEATNYSAALHGMAYATQNYLSKCDQRVRSTCWLPGDELLTMGIVPPPPPAPPPPYSTLDFSPAPSASPSSTSVSSGCSTAVQRICSAACNGAVISVRRCLTAALQEEELERMRITQRAAVLQDLDNDLRRLSTPTQCHTKTLQQIHDLQEATSVGSFARLSASDQEQSLRMNDGSPVEMRKSSAQLHSQSRRSSNVLEVIGASEDFSGVPGYGGSPSSDYISQMMVKRLSNADAEEIRRQSQYFTDSEANNMIEKVQEVGYYRNRSPSQTYLN